MIKVSVRWTDIKVVCSLNKGASKHMLQKSTELKRKIDKSTIIVEELNTTLLIANETAKQKSWKIEDLRNTIHHLHVMGFIEHCPQLTACSS